jgi:pyruvate dehydrogenase E1 component alpha subunit
MVVEFMVHRLGPHSKGDDTRPPHVVELLWKHDWYTRYAESHPEQFDRLDRGARAMIRAITEEVSARPCA